MKCDSCPHNEHEFSSCFEWPNCDCSKRYASFCDNRIVDALADKDK